MDLQKLKNTTLACRAITRQLTTEEKNRSLLLMVEDLERKKAFGDLVALLYQGRAEHLQHHGLQAGPTLSFPYLRHLQEQISSEAAPSVNFRLLLFIALEMIPKGSGKYANTSTATLCNQSKNNNNKIPPFLITLGLMVSVLSPSFYAHLQDPSQEQDRLFFFTECKSAKELSRHPTLSEFVNSVCGIVNTKELRLAAAKILGTGKEFHLEQFLALQDVSTQTEDFQKSLGLNLPLDHVRRRKNNKNKRRED